jgi:hypothetical protein
MDGTQFSPELHSACPKRTSTSTGSGDNGGVIGTVLEREDVVPHFFFHVRNKRQELSRDEFGLDLPDVATACLMSISAARDLRVAFMVQGHDPRDYAITVVNADHEVVFDLPFSAVLTPGPYGSHAPSPAEAPAGMRSTRH